ncbi:hypothetical protein, partial [Achromobacter sp. GbtcB20]|uniref:hypothetical protein n=1 Tax=Achromobacter sp. GbtcB20 TaxID=2824765 RepID=UPI001C2FECC1
NGSFLGGCICGGSSPCGNAFYGFSHDAQVEETSEVNSIILPGGYASVSKSNTVVAAVWQNSTCQNDENFNQAKILVLSYGITTHVFYWNT